MVEINGTALPIGVAIRLAKNSKIMDEVVEQFKARERLLLEEFGSEGEPGSFSIPKENIDLMSTAMTMLMTEELDLDIQAVTVEELGSDTVIRPSAILVLDWFFFPKTEQLEAA
jgi:hypothetical protein